jgi:hypothetical protein
VFDRKKRSREHWLKKRDRETPLRADFLTDLK